MAFSLHPTTERQEQILQLAGELANTFARRATEYDWVGRFPYENYQDLHTSGYLQLTIPVELGGRGANIVEVALAQARLAQGCPSTALVTTMHLGNIAKMAASKEASGPLFQRICQAVITDGALINSALSEPATGSPSRGGLPTTTARRQADGSWLINGRKTYTTGSSVLHFFLVSCSIADDAPEDTHLPSLSASRGTFLVERNMQGVSIEETWNSLSMRLSASHDLILDNVHVGAEAHTSLLDIPPETTAMWGLPLAAVYLGIGQGARNEAIRFAKKRQPSSLKEPISSLPHIQDKVARMDLALLQSETVLFAVAQACLLSPGSVPGSQIAAAKYLATNHSAEITDLAMRLVGAAALSPGLPVQRFYRDIRAGFSNPPMDDVTLGLLSKQAFAEDEKV